MRIKQVLERDLPKYLEKESPGDPNWKGFIKFWLEANGFENSKIVDGYGDGVNLCDLSVIDPDLVSLDRYFRRNKCFRERKRGDYPHGDTLLKVNKDRLLQLFACLESKIGP